MALAELAVMAAEDWLKPGGILVVKMFQGEGFEPAIADMRDKFAKVRVVKPKACLLYTSDAADDSVLV